MDPSDLPLKIFPISENFYLEFTENSANPRKGRFELKHTDYNIALASITGTNQAQKTLFKRFKWVKLIGTETTLYLNISSLSKQLDVSRMKVIKNSVKPGVLADALYFHGIISKVDKNMTQYARKWEEIGLNEQEFCHISYVIEQFRESVLRTIKIKNRLFLRIPRKDMFKLSGVARTAVFYSDGSITIQTSKDQIIGTGSYKKVKKSLEYKTGRILAEANLNSKVYSFKEKRVNRELEAMERLKNNETSVKLIRSTVRLDSKGIVKNKFIMEFYEKGSLRTYLKNNTISDEEILQLLKRLAFCVFETHLAGIIHKDLKYDNFFVDSRGHVFLGDFGMALINAKFCGSLSYMAPELWDSERELHSSSDIFSLGVIFYRLLNGNNDPFQKYKLEWRDPRQAPSEFNKTEDFSLFCRGSGPLTQLVVRMLALDPSKRPTAEEVWCLLNELIMY